MDPVTALVIVDMVDTVPTPGTEVAMDNKSPMSNKVNQSAVG